MTGATRDNDGLRTELSLRDVTRQIWLGRSVLAWSVGALLLIACIDILVSRPVYQATMMLAPVKALDQMNSPEPLISASKLLGGGEDVTRFQIYLKRYTSLDVAAALERDHHVLRRIYARRWDARTKQWRPSFSFGKLLRRLFGLPVSESPTIFDLRDFLSRNIEITPGTGEELQTVTFADSDPVFARDLLLWMHQEGEGLSKLQASKQAQNNIAYLQTQLSTVSGTEQRTVLIDLLAKQENQLMLSQGGGGYSAEVIEEPAVPDLPSSPNPPLLLALAIIGGLAIGIFANVVILLVDKTATPKRIVLVPARFSRSVGTNVKEMLRPVSRA